jgi:hypothetical protein
MEELRSRVAAEIVRQLAYAREIASRTEQYGCPIEHARGIAGAHRRTYGFLENGDAKGYRAAGGTAGCDAESGARQAVRTASCARNEVNWYKGNSRETHLAQDFRKVVK